ncbi:MAG: hypothetical protein JWN73_4223 [Betaproteobacteria bacterium]|nr:hypothetical protein [Betaproteobacteria bacterium]
MKRALCAAALALAAAATLPAQAQDYPNRPIRFVLGPAPDLLPRIVGEKLLVSMGQPVVIDQRPGAGGIIATDTVAKSPPDGYTWLMSTASSLITGTFTPNVPFNQARDVEPVILMASIPFVLVINPDVPAKSVGELVALARAQPGKLNYASSGNGGSGHLVGEMFKHAAKIDMLHVPYKGVAPSVTDLMGGQVQVSFIPAQAALPQAKMGKLRALAVTSLARSVSAPELPTVAESGYPGFEMIGWNGLHVPAKTPRAIIVKINAEMAKALALPDVRERMAVAGLEPAPSSVEAFDAFVKRDVARYTQVIRDSKIVFE